MKKRAFTLIELLVVIAIIAILATIILIVLSNARPKADRASALESINGAMKAAAACVADATAGTSPLVNYAVEPNGGTVCSGTSSIAQSTWPTSEQFGYDWSNLRVNKDYGVTQVGASGASTIPGDGGPRTDLSCSATNVGGTSVYQSCK